MRHGKKQESMAHSKEGIVWSSTEIALQEAQALNLLEKDFKSTVLNMLKELKKIIKKELRTGVVAQFVACEALGSAPHLKNDGCKTL